MSNKHTVVSVCNSRCFVKNMLDKVTLLDASMKRQNPPKQITLHNTELHSAVRLRPPNPSHRRSEMFCDMEMKTSEMEKKRD